MPDSTVFDRTRGTPPLDWGDAFERLPLQAPAASAWPAMATRLALRTRRTQRRRHWALAASMAAVLLAPVIAWRATLAPERADATASHSTPTPSPAMPDAQGPGAASTPPTAGAPQGAPAAVDRRLAAQAETPPAVATEPAAAPPRARAVESPRSRASRVATTAARAVATPAPAHGHATADAARLAALQAESARLEQLLRATGQDTAADAPSLVLASVLAEDVRRIDGALADPALDPAMRTALWDSRVRALREVAAVETAQRWRNAQGLSMDTALVRVD